MYINLKNFITLLIIILSFTHSIGQGLIDGLEDLREGIIYAKCADQLSTDKDKFIENDFVIALFSPKYKTVEDTFFVKTFPIKKAYAVRTKAATKNWKHLPCMNGTCLATNPKLCVGFVLSYQEEERLIIRKGEILSNRFIFKKHKLISPAYFEISDRKFESIQFKNNEVVRVFENKEEGIIYMKFKAGHWWDWRALMGCTSYQGCEPRKPRGKIILAQMRLTDLGYYNGPIDNKKNDKFMAALKLYQKSHNLPTGNFNLETIKHLKI